MTIAGLISEDLIAGLIFMISVFEIDRIAWAAAFFPECTASCVLHYTFTDRVESADISSSYDGLTRSDLYI